MACAVPVVATDVGDSVFVLGDAGRVVSPKNPEAMAQACLELLRLPGDGRRTLGMKGRQRVEDQFSLQAAVKQLEGLLG
jgi:glycosyltransferase involved in cell wall biosynthesis